MASQQHGTHWVDKLVTGIEKWQKKQNLKQLHVDDMKTPSGRVHTGALRGVLLHDIVAKALRTDQPDTISTYVFNDMDAMDSLPGYLNREVYESHMGEPLHKIPAPPLEESGIDFTGATKAEMDQYRHASSFAEFYALDFIQAFEKLGASPKIVWSHELYEAGKMDKVIRHVLDHVDDFRAIYKEVADYELPEKWYPFQVFCPQCGKVGSTLVTDWDGEQVTFECQPHKVDWAEGCGHTGKVSPFGGTGKLLWKVDWPAHWQVMGVNVEGAGKDHTSAGGSRDMANAMVKRIFNAVVPFDIPYEWILIRGTKMSSSKGIGTSAREFVELFPPEVGRFLFVNKHFNQVIDFDPTTMSIPDLFDEYDQAARIYWQQEEGDQRLGRSFQLSQVTESTVSQPHFLPRFRDIALWMQYPELDVIQQFEEVKGAPLTQEEQQELRQRQVYAKLWLDRYAPEEFQFTPRDEMPKRAIELSEEQLKFLENVEKILSEKEWDPQELQQQLYDHAKDSLGAKAGFQAIYLAYLGKTSGPRAAWLLLSMDRKFRNRRLEQIKTALQPTEVVSSENQSENLDSQVRETFPGIFFAQVRISGVDIKKSSKPLERRKKEVVESLEQLTTKEVGEMLPIQEYRKIFKATGTDWHSKRPSPEALLRRIALKKGLYTINTAVDAYNLAVIETGVGLGGFDAAQISEPVVMRFSKEGESMHLLGDDEPTLTRAGQLVYADTEKPITIDLNYRDIDQSKITTESTDILLFADGAPGLSQTEVVDALKKGAEYIQEFCGGEIGEVEIFT